MPILHVRNETNAGWYDFGAQGPQGHQGYQGSQGSTGATGSQGFQGTVGNQGSQGGVGSTGPTGSTGSTGSQGDQGAVGNQGNQGISGTQGYQGNQGNIGDTGAQGSAGATGPQGNQGITGSKGDQGSQGSAGATGAQGNQGAAGSQGTQGGSGSQGSQGSQGNQGNQGYQGNTGEVGAASITWRGVWDSGTAYVDGDAVSSGGTSYICILSHTNHVPPDGAYWQVLSTQGNQGSTGAQGPAGTQGTQGLTGSTGAQGSQGNQGNIGAQGSTGATGSTGTTGSQGNQGASGAQGSQGSTGTTGATGSQGSQGKQGLTGVQGSTGAQGSQGNIGSQGSTGATGATGNTGATGAAGSQGSQGNIGSQGSIGATGSTGSTGATGAAGSQGSQGAQGAQGLLGNVLAHAVSIDSGGYFKIGTGTKDSSLNGIQIDDTEIVGQASGVDQVVFGTDGKLKAGTGAVLLDAHGLSLGSGTSDYNQIKFFDPSSNLIAMISTLDTASLAEMQIAATAQDVNHTGQLNLTVGYPFPTLLLGKFAGLNMTATSGGSELDLGADLVKITGALTLMHSGLLDPIATIDGNGMFTGAALTAGSTGAIAYSSGTAFPASKNTGDLFFRADLGLLCYWNGTLWVTVNHYEASGSEQTSVAGSVGVVRIRSDYAIKPSTIALSTEVAGANSGTVYWVLQFRSLDSDMTNATNLCNTVDTHADGHGWTNHTPSGLVTPAHYGFFDLHATKYSTPDPILVNWTIYYRLIIT